MTREEAIEILKDLWRTKHSTYLEADIRKALEMAIQALEQEPCEDCIHDGCKDCKYETYPEYYYPCCECKQNYKDEWQKKPHWNHGVCDNCGYDWGKDAPIASVPNFCPNCGCPMEIER